MFKFIYAIYGAIVVIVSTVINLNYLTESGSSSSNWGSRSGGSSYGSGSGGYSGGGHHK